MMLYSIYMQYNLVEVIPNHFEYAMTQVLHTVCTCRQLGGHLIRYPIISDGDTEQQNL